GTSTSWIWLMPSVVVVIFCPPLVGAAGPGAMPLSACAVDAVPQVHHAGCFERPDQLKFDVILSQIVEEPPTVAEQNRDEMDLHLIEQPCPQAFLRGVGAVQHHGPV